MSFPLKMCTYFQNVTWYISNAENASNKTYPSQDLRIRNTIDNSDLMFSKNLTHTFILFKMEITLIYQNLKRQIFF